MKSLFLIRNKSVLINRLNIFREIFVKNSSTNEVYGEGDLMKRIKLGQTLRKISEEGVDTFYKGDLADQIIYEIQNRGRFLI